MEAVRTLKADLGIPEYLDRPHYLRVHMANLRQKVEADPAQPVHLLTELQVGYRLVGLNS